jgi:O-antigen/teichoic acid export membrane protein
LINVLAGPVGIALIMLRRERTVLTVECIATLSGLCAAFALLPSWGLAGAASGLLITDLIRNGANWVIVQAASPQPETG